MPAINFADRIWVVMLLNEDNRIPSAFEVLDEALTLAGSYAGNMSYAHAGDDIYLFGTGNGTTSVMVRQLPRQLVLNEDIPIIPQETP